MLLPTLLSTTAFALTTNAFLVPLEVANKANGPKVNNLTPTALGSSGQTVNLDCSTCPFALSSTRNGAHEWTTGVKSDLEMKFTTEDNRLNLNGVQLYPPVGLNMQPPQVKQIAKEIDASVRIKNWEAFEGTLGMSFSLDFKEKPFKTAEGIISVVEAELQVFGLDGEMVNVDAVEIKALKKPDGELMIANISTRPASISAQGKKCTTIWCRMMSIIRAKVETARLQAAKAAKKIKTACMGGRFSWRPRPVTVHPPHRGPKVHGGAPKYVDTVPSSHHHHSGPHDTERHRAAAALYAFKKVLKHVLLPVFIGIATGMLVSAIGMLVGHVIVFFWMRHRRNQRGVYERVEQVEKDGGLPKYEELDGTEVEIVDEKTESV